VRTIMLVVQGEEEVPTHGRPRESLGHEQTATAYSC
jgi:hypothetical protein